MNWKMTEGEASGEKKAVDGIGTVPKGGKSNDHEEPGTGTEKCLLPNEDARRKERRGGEKGKG